MRVKRKNFSVYILECLDGTYYTGMTNDMEARFRAHSEGRGARYTRARGVKCVVYQEGGLTRSDALKREAAIKKLSRKEKERLVQGVQSV
jgi:putative endonuclease